MKRSVSEPLCSLATRSDDLKLNINGLKTRFPIKINGFYIGSSENLTQSVPDSDLVDNIQKKRRSLRESTPIKIEGSVFSRSDDSQNTNFESIQMPFGDFNPTCNNVTCNRKFTARIVKDSEKEIDVPTNIASKTPTNKYCNQVENVINQMKTTLTCIGHGVSYKTFQNINRKAFQGCLNYFGVKSFMMPLHNGKVH